MDASVKRAATRKRPSKTQDNLVYAAVWLACLAPLVWLTARGAWCGDLAGTAGFGAATYFVTHASADWIWTIPAVGVPFFALLGTASAAREPRAAPRLAGIGVAVASAAVALVLFAPPWLSATLSSSPSSTFRHPSPPRWWGEL